jgi:hypothetical protein
VAGMMTVPRAPRPQTVGTGREGRLRSNPQCKNRPRLGRQIEA